MITKSPFWIIMRRSRAKTRRLRRVLFWGVIGLVLLLSGSHLAVELGTRGRTYNSLKDIPANRVGLLLGTSKFSRTGEVNPFFARRIDAAVHLFQQGKIDFILVSGDNAHASYNEPSAFRKELIARGIPAARIYLDFAGFRTLDSVIRAREVFGQTSLTVISQQFHNERAIFIARNYGIDAIGFNAEDVSGWRGFRVKLREALARVKVVFDLIFHVQPHFLGDKIDIAVREGGLSRIHSS